MISNSFLYFACAKAMARSVSLNATRKPTVNDQRAMKHRRPQGPSKNIFFQAKQSFDRCGQASPDAPARQSTRLAIMECTTNTFLSLTSSCDRSSMLRILHGHTQPVYKTTICDSLNLYLTRSDWTTRDLKYFDYDILVVILGR